MALFGGPFVHPRRPYRTLRQQYIGNALDALVRAGQVDHWEYWHDTGKPGVAHYDVTIDGKFESYLTRDVERLVIALYRRLGYVWTPVAHPGGTKAWLETPPMRRVES